MGVFKVNINSSATGYFLSLLIRPTATIVRILLEKPDYKKIIFFLFGIGALRGITEEIWILSMNGQLGQVLGSMPLLKTHMTTGLPFILSNVITAYVRWVAFALLAFLCGLFLGGKGRFEDFLRLYGIILGISLVTILPNFIYLFVKNLPVIRFSVSTMYNPTIGIGQLVTSGWLVYVSYKAVMTIHKLPKFESFFTGLLVPLLNIGILVLGAAVVFNLPMLNASSPNKVFSLSTLGFTVATLAAIPIFLWIGYVLDRKNIQEPKSQ